MAYQNSTLSEAGDFDYAIGEKGEAVLVLFQGRITAREIPQLEQCATMLCEKPQRVVIFSFSGVDGFLPGAHVYFTQFLKQLRDLQKLVGLCAFRPEIKESLRQSGILRQPELFHDVAEGFRVLHHRLKTMPGPEDSTDKN
ncbi:MAG TPA: STAS domain-containing protein [Bdellovibrionales bacterium]|nr:STAS domain-containing protein [Bdellovibrionales bacterium]